MAPSALLRSRSEVIQAEKMAKTYNNMDEILNFILQESDEDIDLGEDDDDKSELNSDWEYEEEEEHQNVVRDITKLRGYPRSNVKTRHYVPTHSAVSPPPQTIRGQDSPTLMYPEGLDEIDNAILSPPILPPPLRNSTMEVDTASDLTYSESESDLEPDMSDLDPDNSDTNADSERFIRQ